jgi:putative ABC transport system permease protein
MLAERITALWLRIKALFRRRQLDRDLDDELQFHLAMREQKLAEDGVPAAEAHYAARREFGNETTAKEMNREMWTFASVETLWQDIRYGLRQLRHSPGFTAVAIGTLALGLAASTAIFSVINGVLLEPLEYANPGQLVALQLFVPKLAHKFPLVPLNPTAYLAWSHQAKSLAGIGLVEEGVTLNLTGGGSPTLLSADAVTSSLFDVLGVQPQLGRNFLPDDDQSGHSHEAILTNALWLSRFHGDPDVLGRSVTLNGTPYRVVGILPPSFQFPHGNQLIATSGPAPAPALFVPEMFEKWELAPDAGFGFGAIARLRPGVIRARATAELNVILSRQFQSQTFMPNPRAVIMPLRDMMVRSSKRGLWLLLAAVLSVLLIICVNLANLVLTRATAREHEAAIRSALGASRGRLLQQTIAETLLLGLIGGALGLVLTHWVLWALLAIAPSGLPRLQNVHLDGAVLAFTLTISILAGVLAGLLPAWRRARANPQDALRSSGVRGTESAVHLRARESLVAIETAISAMLLVAAGLLLTSFVKLEGVPRGFAVEHVLTVNLQLPAAQYSTAEQRAEFWRSVLDATSRLPGVESSAVTSWLPLGGEMDDDPVNLPGDTRPAAERPFASYRRVSPAYFKLLGIPLLRGREMKWADAGTDAVVISAATASTVWPGINPLGRRFDVDPSSRFAGYRVVGVVGDTRSVSLFKAPAPMVYELYDGSQTGSLILRARLPATAVASELRRTIWKIDPSVAVPRIRSMGRILSASLAPQRFEALLTSLFAAAALLLACLGIYGVVTYSVVCRTHEIGIRMALGAQKGEVLGRAVRRGMMPVLLGLGAGIMGALGLTRLLSNLLYGVKPTDPLTFVLVSLTLTSVALLACYIPARRATKIDPMVALRCE